MSDKLISIRLPKLLLKDLKKLIIINHYLDISEELRSIIRQKTLQYMNPFSEVGKLREALELDARKQNKNEELIDQLKKLLEVKK